eukprot:bmy_20469T0
MEEKRESFLMCFPYVPAYAFWTIAKTTPVQQNQKAQISSIINTENWNKFCLNMWKKELSVVLWTTLLQQFSEQFFKIELSQSLREWSWKSREELIGTENAKEQFHRLEYFKPFNLKWIMGNNWEKPDSELWKEFCCDPLPSDNTDDKALDAQRLKPQENCLSVGFLNNYHKTDNLTSLEGKENAHQNFRLEKWHIT